MTYFHFSIGPVQEFVCQARRTNDFWGGSFLLSWLAGVAMLSAQKQGAKACYPLPPEDYLDWLTGEKRPADGALLAKVGAIPNRFCMEVTAEFDPIKLEHAVIAAWQALAEHTRRQMFDDKPFCSAGAAVWQRQILDQPGGLWEIMWIISEDQAPGALDQRKHWRNHLRKPEGAPFCALMAAWQALPLTPEQKKMATAQGYRLQRDDMGDLRAVANQDEPEKTAAKQENLCAPALIKRHFAKSFAAFSFNDTELNLKGWELPDNVPSSHYFAAAAWLSRMLSHVPPEQLREHEELVAKLLKGRDEKGDEAKTRLTMVAKAKHKYGHAKESCALHAPSWFDNEIENADIPENNKKRILESLRKLYQATKKTSKNPSEAEGGSKPGTHYAILLMDGDKMGETLKIDPVYVAEALNRFTKKVPCIVKKYSGFLVYAGGDDVLALLPPQTALDCASQLRCAYEDSFNESQRHKPEVEIAEPSISCALLYAHSKTPLTPLLSSAHHLLDQVAKRESGRNSIAIQIWKRSGLNLSYAQKWAVLFPKPSEATEGIDKLLRHLVQDANRTQKQVSTKFFQRAQDVMREIAGLYPQNQDIEAASEAAREASKRLHTTCEMLLKQEYRHGRPKHKDETELDREQDISQLIQSLLKMAVKPQSQQGNKQANKQGETDDNTPPQAEFLALLKFLVDNFLEADEEGNTR